MRSHKTRLLLALLYQLYRGSVFTAAILISADRTSFYLSADTATLLAATAASLVPALIILQLYLTGSQVLLAPSRIAKLLEAITATAATIATVRVGGPVVLFALAAIGDVIVFVFLLLYRQPDIDSTEPSLPVTSIEEVEES